LGFNEKGTEVLVVLFRGTAKDKDVVQVGETEVQLFEDLHETLEVLGGVLQAKYEGKLENTKRSGNSRLYVIRVDRNLVIHPHKISFGKGGAAGKAVGVVLDMWDLVKVRDGASVQGSVISTRPPTALLGHEMEGG
jgi:RecB family endonuclease NucS